MERLLGLVSSTEMKRATHTQKIRVKIKDEADRTDPETERTGPSVTDIKNELIQKEENGLNITPVLRSEPARGDMSSADPLHLIHFSRVSVKLVDCCKTRRRSGTEKSTDGEQHENMIWVESYTPSSTVPSDSTKPSWSHETVATCTSSAKPVNSRLFHHPARKGGVSTKLLNKTKMIEKKEAEKETSSGQRLPRVKPYYCSLCDKTFQMERSLRWHMLNHTIGNPYQCAQCGKSFLYKAGLDDHIRRHTGERPYKCTECGKTFGRVSCLNLHLRIHTGERPYECNQCGKKFFYVGGLKSHYRVHTGEKPYKCTLCGQNFSQVGNRKVHMRRHQLPHTKVKPYSCPQCGKRFTKKENLRVHQYTHMEVSPHHCDKCGKNFCTKAYLKKHRCRRLETDNS